MFVHSVLGVNCSFNGSAFLMIPAKTFWLRKPVLNIWNVYFNMVCIFTFPYISVSWVINFDIYASTAFFNMFRKPESQLKYSKKNTKHEMELSRAINITSWTNGIDSETRNRIQYETTKFRMNRNGVKRLLPSKFFMHREVFQTAGKKIQTKMHLDRQQKRMPYFSLWETSFDFHHPKSCVIINTNRIIQMRVLTSPTSRRMASAAL